MKEIILLYMVIMKGKNETLTDTLLQFFEEYLEYGKDPYNNVDE